VTLQCHLSEEDRRTAPDSAFIDAPGIDYFENLCLQPNTTCKLGKKFMEPKLGVPTERVAHYVGLHYYVDKELQASSLPACRRACEIDDDFLCRSFLYKSTITTGYNCHLFHMDHKTLPDGPATYLNTERPLLDNGNPLGLYQENTCDDKELSSDSPTPAPVPVRTPPGIPGGGSDDPLGGGNGQFNMNAEGQDCDHTGTCYDGKFPNGKINPPLLGFTQLMRNNFE